MRREIKRLRRLIDKMQRLQTEMDETAEEFRRTYASLPNTDDPGLAEAFGNAALPAPTDDYGIDQLVGDLRA